MAESGALSPLDAAHLVYQTALRHLHEPTHLVVLKSVYGGLIFGLAGLFSLVAAAGMPSVK